MKKHNIDGLKAVIIGLGFAANISMFLLARWGFELWSITLMASSGQK